MTTATPPDDDPAWWPDHDAFTAMGCRHRLDFETQVTQFETGQPAFAISK